MEIIKPIPTIIIGLFLSIEFSFSSETALIFTPFFSSTYYSSGSVFQPEKDGKTIITNPIPSPGGTLIAFVLKIMSQKFPGKKIDKKIQS